MAGTRLRVMKTVLGGLIVTAGLSACAGPSQSSEQRSNLPKAFLDEGGTASAYGSSYTGSYLAGRHALREKDAGAAAEYFDEALTGRQDDVYLIRGAFQAVLAKGNVEKAIELANILVESDGDKSAAHLVLAIDNIRKGDFAKAKEHLTQTNDSGFNVLVKPLLMSWIVMGEGDVDAALAELNVLDKYDGFDALKDYHAALLVDVSGQVQRAEEQYAKAMQGPAARAVRLVQSYGTFLIEQGKDDEARALFEEYIKTYPLSPTINRMLEDMAAGKKIEPVLNTAADGAAEALYSAASVIGQERAVGLAATYTYFTLMLRPDFPVAQVLLAETAEGGDRWQEAYNLYNQIESDSAYYKNARIRSAWTKYKMGQQDEAVAWLEEIAAQYPEDIEAMVVLADMYRDQKDWSEAARQYGRAVDRLQNYENRHWSLFYARGIAYEQSKQWKNAEADLLKSLELRPDYPPVLNYLAYSWVDRDENLEEAKEMLIKAVSLRPRDGFIVDSLGWLYYRLGEFDDAVIQLEKAVSLEAADPTINDHLGDAYWRAGRRDEAKYQWRRALWLDPTPDQIPLIEEKLKSGLKDEIKAEN